MPVRRADPSSAASSVFLGARSSWTSSSHQASRVSLQVPWQGSLLSCCGCTGPKPFCNFHCLEQPGHGSSCHHSPSSSASTTSRLSFHECWTVPSKAPALRLLWNRLDPSSRVSLLRSPHRFAPFDPRGCQPTWAPIVLLHQVRRSGLSSRRWTDSAPGAVACLGRRAGCSF